jgi:hypothetical protein
MGLKDVFQRDFGVVELKIANAASLKAVSVKVQYGSILDFRKV